MRWSVALVLLMSVAARAADYAGVYRSEKVGLQLDRTGDGYTGKLTVGNGNYPVTAKENGAALEGTFTSEGAKFEFSAQLDGEKMTLRSAGASYELVRQPKPQVPVQPPQPPQPVVPNPLQPQTHPAAAATDAPSGDAAIDVLKNLGAPHSDAKRDWLMLVYLDGDNNLDPQGEFNIKQMERGLPESGVEVIVLYDRPIRKNKAGDINHPRLYHIKRDQGHEAIDSEVLKNFGAINMADPRMLAAFIEGAVKAYPARQHALFTWDHGGGWSALTSDEHAPGKPNNFDTMDMPRFRSGLTAGMQAAGLKKWDIIAFDMCLMAQLEVAAEIHDLTDVMVASEAVEPGKGMPYNRVMAAFGKGTFGGRRIGADIVIEYDKFHKNEGEYITTLSALDMSVFDDVNTKLNALADKLIPAMPRGWSALAKSCFYAEQYTSSRDDFRQGKSALQSIDLLDSLKKCRAAMADFPAENEYKDLVQTMDRFVIASANSQRRQMSNGVAIYAPVIKDAYNPDFEKLVFAKISHWPKLFQTFYAEQAKNIDPPKFGKIELVDHEGKPATAVKPLCGMRTSIEVDGRNMVWIKQMAGVRDPQLGGVRVLIQDYVLDDKYLEKLSKGHEHFSQDVDLIMPQLNDGPNKLHEPQYGLMFLMSNGEKNVECMIDNSDLGDPTSFNVLVTIEHPSLGERPVRAVMHADALTLSVRTTTLIQTTPDGRTVLQQIRPPADAKVTPIFRVIKDDGSKELIAKDSLIWKNGLSFTIDLLPAAEYEVILTAETMTGASSTTRFRFKAETDQRFVDAKRTWQSFRPEMMVGTWQWALLLDNGVKEVDTLMTCEATKDPLTYKLTVDAPGEEGKRKISKGLLILEIHDQPFYRLIVFPEGRGQPAVMLGAMWWVPENGQARIVNRSLALDLNMVWLKKSGGGPGPVAKEEPPHPQIPQGWQTVTDANRLIALAVPPNFVNNPQLVQQVRNVFPGYDFGGIDANFGAAIEVIRFDGVNDPNTVLRTMMNGAQQMGIRFQLNPMQRSRIDGVECASCDGQTMNANGQVFTIGVNLIPTSKGVVAVNFVCAPANFQAALPTLQQISASIRVAKQNQ